MEYLSAFKALNTRGVPVNSLEVSAVREVLGRLCDWSFLPSSAVDVVHRYSLTTVEIFDMLFRYKFIEPREIAAMLSYTFGLNCIILEDDLEIKYGQQISEKNGLSVHQKNNGLDHNVFMRMDSIISEAQINIDFPGRANSVYYVLPSNFRQVLGKEEHEWNYYIMFSRYMQYCVDNKATDLHLEVVHQGKTEIYRAMCRIGTDREECKLFNINAKINKDLIREAIKLSSNPQAIADLDAGLGVVVTLQDVFKDGRLEVRFTVEKVLGGYYCVSRLHEQKNVSLKLDDLGFDPAIVRELKNIAERPSGLTIFTGKLRTGKNTSMSAMSNYIASQGGKFSLMALDDPIEIVGPYPQVDYRGDVSLLKAGIRLAKKLDLDFVSLNEIPNSEVAFGVRDLVNSSIHTMTTWHMNRIWHLPHKLFEYFGESYRDLISQMNLVCNQRLYKKQCRHCVKTIHREAYAPDGNVPDERIYQFFVKHNLTSSNVAQGCEKCSGTGYEKGSIVVLPEIVVFTQDLVLDLFMADRPYEMETVLMKYVISSPFSLEQQMCKALRDGRLSSRDVLSIV